MEHMNDDLVFSETQTLWLININRVAGCVSVVASCLILYSVTGADKIRTFHRLLIAMACSDIIFSLHEVAFTLLTPKWNTSIPGARGNQATCSAQGFFLQFSSVVPFYNASLCIFYALTIRYGVNEKTMARFYEPWFHAIPILWALTTASVGVALQLFNLVEIQPGGCYLAVVPHGCEEDSSIECARGQLERLTTEQVQWIFASLSFYIPLIAIVFSNVQVYLTVRRQMMRISRLSVTSDNFLRTVRDVARQCYFYVGAYILTYAFVAANYISHQYFGVSYYPITFLHWMLHPLQGFFNFLVYIRPRYVRVRGAHPSESRWMSFRRSLRSQSVQDIEDQLVDQNNDPCSENTDTLSSSQRQNWNNSLRSAFSPGFLFARPTPKEQNSKQSQQVPSNGVGPHDEEDGSQPRQTPSKQSVSTIDA